MTAAELVPEYVQAGALVAAGGWAYWRFFHQRSDEPATDIDVDTRFVGVQGDWHVVEVTATLENKSFVRHRYENFRMNLRYLLPADEIVDGDESLHFQLVFPHSIDEDRLERGSHRYFANADYINPRQRFHHRYVTFVPAAATFVRIHCRFEFRQAGVWSRSRTARARGGTVMVDSQRVFAVPVPANTGTPTSPPVRSQQ